MKIKTKNKNVIIGVVVFSIVCLTISLCEESSVLPGSVFPDTVKLSYPYNNNSVRVWICSDIHLSEKNHKHWSNVINDAINLNADIGFCNGDMIDYSHNEYDKDYQSMWNLFWYNTDDYYGWFDTIKFFNYSHVIVGNHDAGWRIGSNGTGFNVSEQSTYLMGNVLFITIGDMFPNPDNFTVDYNYNHSGVYNDYIPWLNSTIQNNQNKSIIILCHFPLYDTVYGTNQTTQAHENPWMEYENNSRSMIDMLNWLEDNGFNVDAWISGHTHMSHTTRNFVKKYGTVFINDLVVVDNKNQSRSSSIFLDFNIGSDSVMVQAFSHSRQIWLTKHVGGK